MASLYEFPWAVLLGYKVKGKTEYLCGGSLIESNIKKKLNLLKFANFIHNTIFISERIVLTSAHCIKPEL